MHTARQLTAEMHRLGVHYLVGDSQPGSGQPLSPAELLAGLTVQSDARMRSALIAVLLQFPEFARQAQTVVEMLDQPFHRIFQLYYTAAHYLQSVYKDGLTRVLGRRQKIPDYFSEELHIMQGDRPSSDPLRQLANRHQEITGLAINWYGTYHHVAQRVIARLEKEQEWARGL